MADYITVGAYKTQHRITGGEKDALIASKITAASRDVNGRTGREFSAWTGGDPEGTATARYFHPYSCESVRVDDCYDITEVAVDFTDSGTYTALTAADYQTYPLNGIGPNGQTGWPVERITLVTYSYQFPRWRRPSVKVTAKWGWEAVPDDVKEACQQITARLIYEDSVPSGATPPNPDFGLPGSPLQRQWTVERLLRPYTRVERVIGVA